MGTAEQSLGYTAIAHFFGALLLYAVRASEASRLVRVLRGRWLGFFGRYSYGIYVLHIPVRSMLNWVGLGANDLPLVLGSRLPAVLAHFALATGLSVVAALISWRLIEQPALRLKNRWTTARCTPDKTTEMSVAFGS
jgi:peptidoglycan/LPS O-acetylase OafA/YrhL